MRRLAATLSLGILSMGCVSLEGQGLPGAPVHTPDAKKLHPASLAAAERVQELGQRIIEQNTFTGLSPLFHTVSVPEPILFHRGPDELFVSDGVVNRCRTDEELAAVLCVELGRMMAEKRIAKAHGVNLASVIEVTPATEVIGTGTVASTEVVPQDPVTVEKPGDVPDADALARDLLRGAGFDPEALAQTRELLRGAKRIDSLVKQVAGPSAAPRWQR